MLVLSRKRNELAIIGYDIKIMNLKILCNHDRPWITVPCGVSDYREISSLWMSRKTSSSPVRTKPPNARNRPRFAGWRVLFTTPYKIHPFVQRVLKEIKDRFPGIRVSAKYHPQEHTLELIPPKGTEVAWLDRVGVEIAALQGEIHRAMEDDNP